MRKPVIWIILGLCLLALAVFFFTKSPPVEDIYTRLMTRGNGYLEKGDGTNAIAAYSQALKMAPEQVDVRLNLANAYLLAGENQQAIEQAQQALNLDHNSGGAYYLLGLAYLHLNQAEQAVQAFQQSQRIDPAITALNFQLGLAQERLGHFDDAIREFETIVQFEPDHPSAHYQLSRLYQRVGRAQEAAQEMEKHQQIQAKNPTVAGGPSAFERCKYTQPRIAFVLEQPDRNGIPVHFVDATADAFGQSASAYRGPPGVIDYNHDGRNSLFVRDNDKGFRLLNNQKGRFEPLGELLPDKSGSTYRRCLVGDLDNDRFEDVVVIGEQASHAFKFATNGHFREVTAAVGLKDLKARDGLLADLDFTGKLDLLTVLPDAQGLRVYRNLGSFYFKEDSTNSGLPTILSGVEHLAIEDWNNEDLPGVFVTRTGKPPLFFAKQRAGPFVETNSSSDWPVGSVIITGDLNNDLRPDLVIASSDEVHIVFNGLKEQVNLPAQGLNPSGILLLDYDNDGWLDILAYGNGLRVWRNLGKAGFTETTGNLGVEKLEPVDSVVAADFDNDGDTDLIVSTAKGLRFLRNDGGNANKQLKLQLVGNRSNASALGVRVELASDRWHTLRTVQQLPLEIGVGQHSKLDALKVHWFDLATTIVDVPVGAQPLNVVELTLPTGSCPYLYAWDGHGFKFVTDILGAAPLGLPLTGNRYLEADPDEFLALGDDQRFPPKDGAYELRVTEELREVLYLDTAQLVVVDHPADTLVCPTSKLHPGKPFPPHQLWTLRPVTTLKHAVRSDGLDVTKTLAQTDGKMVSPVRLREPQLRGLAEPFSVTLDFGELDVQRPLVLILNGWLRFGGGMANVAASLDANLPFPFPTLEVELPDSSWKTVQVDVGAPAGKTKTILIDLDKKLPRGAHRLRLSTAFEIHWDSASLCEKVASDQNHQFTLKPDRTNLRWHGFGRFADLPDCHPLTPQYEDVQLTPPWSRTPTGWCTRYGPVDELVREEDDALVLLNGGDELALSFDSQRLPTKPDGFARDFFLYAAGWDKDADFHVGQGWSVEPLPFHGMDDQAYGRQERPTTLNDAWIKTYNTRWVGPMTLSKRER
jgi:tetratricopeptide (TPR) repeat protein